MCQDMYYNQFTKQLFGKGGWCKVCFVLSHEKDNYANPRGRVDISFSPKIKITHVFDFREVNIASTSGIR